MTEIHATVHVSSLADEGATMLKDWPTQNHDLNLMKQIWSELKRRIYQKSPCNLEVLLEIRHREWHLIPVKMIYMHPFQSTLEELFKLGKVT